MTVMQLDRIYFSKFRKPFISGDQKINKSIGRVRTSPDTSNEHERRYWVQHFVDFVGLVKLTHYASRSNCCFPKGKGHIKEE